MKHDWNSVTVPHDGATVYVLAMDGVGKYEVPFPVLQRRLLAKRVYAHFRRGVATM